MAGKLKRYPELSVVRARPRSLLALTTKKVVFLIDQEDTELGGKGGERGGQ